MDSTAMKRVLSVQSHVVHGYVGNKSATFPLQLLGFDVDQVNTVQFSNHTGYPVVKGHKLDDVQLQQILRGLQDNGLLDQYSHLLTGYVGSVSALRALLEFITFMKGQHPETTFVLDPVLGDCGHLYVPSDAVAIYRDQLCSLADIITPNQFEAELLTNIKITKMDDVLDTLLALHHKGIKRVVITSIEDLDLTGDKSSSSDLVLVGSEVAQPTSDLKRSDLRIFTITFPKLELKFTGTGDLFAALLLAYITPNGPDTATPSFATACEHAIGAMQSVLKRTHLQYTKVMARTDGNPSAAVKVQACELRLIQSRDDLLNPPRVYSAKMWDGVIKK